MGSMWQSQARRWGMTALGLIALVSMALAGCAFLQGGASTGGASSSKVTNVPRYQHIFLIVMENHDYDDIIGSKQAPHLNALAHQYGLATNYWAVAHPSEPNYIALLGGSTFGVVDDNSYTQNAINEPYLGSQLEAARLTWKSYQQGLPAPGFTGDTSDSAGNVYASKHNPFLNFLPHYPESQRAAEMANIVPGSQLAIDLNSDAAPNFAFITPGLCDDMHGDPTCGDEDQLVSAGDSFANDTVTQIMQSSLWSHGNNAIVIVWDESTPGLAIGPKGIDAGGGHVPTIVITSHGPRGVTDSAAYNHYALLLTIEDAFGLGCLQHSCPVAGGVQAMAPLFAG
jgi:phosphatidylinositol-3-phosphatase